VIDRRAFLAGTGAVLLAAPLAAEAQLAGKVTRIGVLEPTSMALNAANLDAFRQGLRELGYVEGRNMRIEYRSADGRSERFPDLAAELVRWQRALRAASV
jgi:putative ABC transport system substrate-binding protein